MRLHSTLKSGNGAWDKVGCLPHVPVEVDFVAKEQVDEAGDVLLRTVGVGKANIIESLKLSCRQGKKAEYVNFTM